MLYNFCKQYFLYKAPDTSTSVASHGEPSESGVARSIKCDEYVNFCNIFVLFSDLVYSRKYLICPGDTSLILYCGNSFAALISLYVYIF